MKKGTLILLLVIFASCRNENVKTKEKIENVGKLYLSTQLKPGERIDTIQLLKYDTLNTQTENSYLWFEYNKIAKSLQSEAELLKNHYTIKEELYSLQPTATLKEEMKQQETKWDNLIKEYNYYDSIMAPLLNDSLTTKDFKGYRAWFRVKSTEVNGVSQNYDSLEVSITPDFKIREFKNEVKKY